MNLLRKIFARIGGSQESSSMAAKNTQDVDVITHAVATNQTDFDVIENPIARAKELLATYEKTRIIDYRAAKKLIDVVGPREIICRLLPNDELNEDDDDNIYIGHGYSHIDQKCKSILVEYHGCNGYFRWSNIDDTVRGDCLICLIRYVTDLKGSDGWLEALKIIAKMELEEKTWWKRAIAKLKQAA